MFFAGVYISPINHVPGAYFSKVGVNGFVCPHGRVDETDTNFKHYSPKELFDLNFTPQNVELRPDTQVHYIPGSVSPPRMDLSYEEEIPILFSPLTDYEDDSNDQPGEYFEEDSQETENNDFDSTSSFNESPLVEENYENV